MASAKMNKRKCFSQSTRSMTEFQNDIFLSQDQPSTSSQATTSSQHHVRSRMRGETRTNSSQGVTLQEIDEQEEMQLISGVIKYLLVMDRSKHIILKANIIKHALDGNTKLFRLIIAKVKEQLSAVFGYQLVEIESTKYILVNKLKNEIPHLIFTKEGSSQVLLFLVLVHIFMLGDSCKEEILWDFLRSLDIITEDKFQHDYFGDVKQLITCDFVSQKYLEKIIMDKNDPTKVEYKWGYRAQNEITYRSALGFVSNIYDRPMKNWKLQYKTVVAQEEKQEEEEDAL